MFMMNKKKEQTGIEPVTLGPAIPRSTTELLFLNWTPNALLNYNRFQAFKKRIKLAFKKMIRKEWKDIINIENQVTCHDTWTRTLLTCNLRRWIRRRSITAQIMQGAIYESYLLSFQSYFTSTSIPVPTTIRY